jgi:hypothetical protein
MKRVIGVAAIALGLIVSLGCSSTVYLNHPSKPHAQLRSDQWDCEQELAARYQSPLIVVIGRTSPRGLRAARELRDEDVLRCLQLKHGWEETTRP